MSAKVIKLLTDAAQLKLDMEESMKHESSSYTYYERESNRTPQCREDAIYLTRVSKQAVNHGQELVEIRKLYKNADPLFRDLKAKSFWFYEKALTESPKILSAKMLKHKFTLLQTSANKLNDEVTRQVRKQIEFYNYDSSSDSD